MWPSVDWHGERGVDTWARTGPRTGQGENPCGGEQFPWPGLWDIGVSVAWTTGAYMGRVPRAGPVGSKLGRRHCPGLWSRVPHALECREDLGSQDLERWVDSWCQSFREA